MIEDVFLTEDQQTEWDGNGDARVVTDDAYQRQSISIAAMQAYVNVDSALTPEVLEEFRGDVEQAVTENTYAEEPVTVEVADIDMDEDLVVFDITTANRSLSVEDDV